jgi:hypothetical protein
MVRMVQSTRDDRSFVMSSIKGTKAGIRLRPATIPDKVESYLPFIYIFQRTASPIRRHRKVFLWSLDLTSSRGADHSGMIPEAGLAA